MTAIIDIVNSLICKAKENECISNVKFVKAFRENLAEHPIDGYIAVVKVEKITKTEDFVGGYAKNNIKGEMFNASFALDVYSGNDITGEDLSATTLKIQQAVCLADESNIIDDSWILPIEFDSNLNAIYREIKFNLSFCLCGEE